MTAEQLVQAIRLKAHRDMVASASSEASKQQGNADRKYQAYGIEKGICCLPSEERLIVLELVIILAGHRREIATEQFVSFPEPVSEERAEKLREARQNALSAWADKFILPPEEEPAMNRGLDGGIGRILPPEEEPAPEEQPDPIRAWLAERFTWVPPCADWSDGAFLLCGEVEPFGLWAIPTDGEWWSIAPSTVRSGIRVVGDTCDAYNDLPDFLAALGAQPPTEEGGPR